MTQNTPFTHPSRTTIPLQIVDSRYPKLSGPYFVGSFTDDELNSKVLEEIDRLQTFSNAINVRKIYESNESENVLVVEDQHRFWEKEVFSKFVDYPKLKRSDLVLVCESPQQDSFVRAPALLPNAEFPLLSVLYVKKALQHENAQVKWRHPEYRSVVEAKKALNKAEQELSDCNDVAFKKARLEPVKERLKKAKAKWASPKLAEARARVEAFQATIDGYLENLEKSGIPAKALLEKTQEKTLNTLDKAAKMTAEKAAATARKSRNKP